MGRRRLEQAAGEKGVEEGEPVLPAGGVTQALDQAACRRGTEERVEVDHEVGELAQRQVEDHARARGVRRTSTPCWSPSYSVTARDSCNGARKEVSSRGRALPGPLTVIVGPKLMISATSPDGTSVRLSGSALRSV